MPWIQVRRSEYKRVNEKERRFIKGQRYTLLSHKANLDIEGRKALKMLLKANKRLNKAYVLKESFGQLWDYSNPTWARKFFENWKSQLRWQRLEPLEKFAAMIERNWDGVVRVTVIRQTRSPLVLWKASTIRFASFSAEPTVSKIKNISCSRSLLRFSQTLEQIHF